MMSTSMLRVREVNRRPTSTQTGYLHSWSQALLFFVSAFTVQRRWLPELFPHSWFDSGRIHEPVRQSMDFEEFKFAVFFFPRDDFRRRFHHSSFVWLDSGYTLIRRSVEVPIRVLVVGGSFARVWRRVTCWCNSRYNSCVNMDSEGEYDGFGSTIHLVSVDSTYRLAFVYFFNSHRAGQFRRCFFRFARTCMTGYQRCHMRQSTGSRSLLAIHEQPRDVYAVPAQFNPLLFYGRAPMYPVHVPSLWCGSADFFTVSQQLGFRVFVSRATRAVVSCWFITSVWRIVVWWWSDDVTSAFTGTLLPEIHGHRPLEV